MMPAQFERSLADKLNSMLQRDAVIKPQAPKVPSEVRDQKNEVSKQERGKSTLAQVPLGKCPGCTGGCKGCVFAALAQSEALKVAVNPVERSTPVAGASAPPGMFSFTKLTPSKEQGLAAPKPLQRDPSVDHAKLPKDANNQSVERRESALHRGDKSPDSSVAIHTQLRGFTAVEPQFKHEIPSAKFSVQFNADHSIATIKHRSEPARVESVGESLSPKSVRVERRVLEASIAPSDLNRAAISGIKAAETGSIIAGAEKSQVKNVVPGTSKLGDDKKIVMLDRNRPQENRYSRQNERSAPSERKPDTRTSLAPETRTRQSRSPDRVVGAYVEAARIKAQPRSEIRSRVENKPLPLVRDRASAKNSEPARGERLTGVTPRPEQSRELLLNRTIVTNRPKPAEVKRLDGLSRKESLGEITGVTSKQSVKANHLQAVRVNKQVESRHADVPAERLSHRAEVVRGASSSHDLRAQHGNVSSRLHGAEVVNSSNLAISRRTSNQIVAQIGAVKELVTRAISGSRIDPIVRKLSISFVNEGLIRLRALNSMNLRGNYRYQTEIRHQIQSLLSLFKKKGVVEVLSEEELKELGAISSALMQFSILKPRIKTRFKARGNSSERENRKKINRPQKSSALDGASSAAAVKGQTQGGALFRDVSSHKYSSGPAAQLSIFSHKSDDEKSDDEQEILEVVY